MYIRESNEFQIQRIMDLEGLDYDEAKEFLWTLIEEDHDLDIDDHEEKLGCGDCFGDAL